MRPNDTWWMGVLMGIAFPAATWFLLTEFTEYLISTGKTGLSEHFIALLSVASNLLPFFWFQNVRTDYALRGLVITTMLIAGVVIVIYWNDFMSA